MAAFKTRTEFLVFTGLDYFSILPSGASFCRNLLTFSRVIVKKFIKPLCIIYFKFAKTIYSLDSVYIL